MKLLKAEVTRTFDPEVNQSFYAIIRDDDSEDNDEELIYFSTPFNNLNKGGFGGHVPGIGTKVIVCKLDNCDSYYYIASLFDHLTNATEGSLIPGIVDKNPSESKFDLRNPLGLGTVGEEIKIQNNAESGFRMIDRKSELIFDERSELFTVGKRITLSNNPQINSITLDADVNGFSDVARVELVGDDPQNFSKSHHSFNVRTTGSQSYVSDQEVFICVKEGADINLINESTGFMNLSYPTYEWGNINLQSKYNGINLLTGQGYVSDTIGPFPLDPSQIRIETLNPANTGGIVLRCKSPTSTIEINTLGQINITGGLGIKIHTAGSLDMYGGAGVNIAAGGPININSPSPVNIDGLEMQLNSGLSSGAQSAAIPVVQSIPISHPLGVLPFNYEA